MRKKFKDVFSVLIIVSIILSVINPVNVSAGNLYIPQENKEDTEVEKNYVWVQDSNGWRYACSDDDYVRSQFMEIDGHTYYFKDDGYMATRWMYIDNNWYYFNMSGYMQTGWLFIVDKYYYMYEDGHMAADEYVDGYYLNKSGVWTKDEWVHDSKGWWLKQKEGGYAVGWKQLEGVLYWFDNSGYMVTGWKYISDNWYYFNGSGEMVTGWQYISGNWYYFESSGRMLHDEAFIEGEEFYYFDDNGVWVPNAYPVEGPGYGIITVGYFEDQVTSYLIDMLNEYRIENGLDPLVVNNELMQCADVRAAECSVLFSHDRPNGESCISLSDRMRGENIAMGTYFEDAYDNACRVMNGWKESTGHNANMLKENYEIVGISSFVSNGCIYYVQDFGL